MPNPEDIKDWAVAGAAVIKTLRDTIRLLPSGPSKDDAARLLERAESEFKQAEASAAQKLGFPICYRHWPPEIMTLGDDDRARCRLCGEGPPKTTQMKVVTGRL
jgi:hypothetical protein